MGISKRNDRNGYSAKIIYGRKGYKEKLSSYKADLANIKDTIDNIIGILNTTELIKKVN